MYVRIYHWTERACHFGPKSMDQSVWALKLGRRRGKHPVRFKRGRSEAGSLSPCGFIELKLNRVEGTLRGILSHLVYSDCTKFFCFRENNAYGELKLTVSSDPHLSVALSLSSIRRRRRNLIWLGIIIVNYICTVWGVLFVCFFCFFCFFCSLFVFFCIIFRVPWYVLHNK